MVFFSFFFSTGNKALHLKPITSDLQKKQTKKKQQQKKNKKKKTTTKNCQILFPRRKKKKETILIVFKNLNTACKDLTAVFIINIWTPS